LQAIVPAGAATELEPQLSRRKVQLVMRNQDRIGFDLVERGSGRCDAAAVVHEVLRPGQPHLAPCKPHPRHFGTEARLQAKGAAMTPRQLLNQPEPRVVTRGLVLAAWVPQAH